MYNNHQKVWNPSDILPTEQSFSRLTWTENTFSLLIVMSCKYHFHIMSLWQSGFAPVWGNGMLISFWKLHNAFTQLTSVKTHSHHCWVQTIINFLILLHQLQYLLTHIYYHGLHKHTVSAQISSYMYNCTYLFFPPGIPSCLNISWTVAIWHCSTYI